jgi:hypothetical protein
MRQYGKLWTRFIWLGTGHAAGSCKHGYEIYNVYKQPINALQFNDVFLCIIFSPACFDL